MTADSTTSKKVVTAMSGGVDSSVAALLLHRQGFEVVGVSMQVWDYRNHGGCSSRATCCAPDDFTDARKVAGMIGVPYYVFDFEETFRREVIDTFVATYQRGLTPNPCIDCNSKVKFRELRDRAARMGIERVATGHYAQVEERADGFHLLRGLDEAKDQSYFLYGLNQHELSRTLFPVGAMQKSEVRALAREAGLATAEKPESQDICFVGDSAQAFIARIGGKGSRGNIVTRAGEVVGHHEGVQNFTVGQRRGLGVGGKSEAHYVIEVDPQRNQVVLGTRDDLRRETFSVNAMNWVSPGLIARIARGELFTFRAVVQVRHRHTGVPVEVTVRSPDTVEVAFSEAWAAVSPGQAAVFYDLSNREVVAGGRITAPAAMRPDSSGAFELAQNL